jgi:hypothetical protein
MGVSATQNAPAPAAHFGSDILAKKYQRPFGRSMYIMCVVTV